MAQQLSQRAQLISFNLAGLYHSEVGKQSGGRISYQYGLYQVRSKPNPAESIIDAFELTREGRLTYCIDEQSLAVLVAQKGLSIGILGHIQDASLCYLEFLDFGEAQRFKDCILYDQRSVTSVRLHIEPAETQYFDTLTAPYRRLITATGEVDALRVETQSINTARTEQRNHIQQLQNTLSALQESRDAQKRDLSSQLADARMSNTALSDQIKALKSSNSLIQSTKDAQSLAISRLNEKLRRTESSQQDSRKCIQSLETQLTTSQSPSVEQSNYIKSLEAETSSMQTKMIQDSKRIQELSASLKCAETAASKQQANAFENQLQSADAANSDLVLKINSVEQERDSYKAGLERAKGAFKVQLRMQSAQMKKSVKQKDQEIGSLRSETLNLKAMTVAMQDQNVEAVQIEVRRLEGVVKEQEQCIVTLRFEKERAVASATALQAEKEQKSQEVDDFQRTVISLQAGHSQKDQTIRTLTSQNDELHTTIATLHSEINEKHQRLKTLYADAELSKQSSLSKDEDMQALEKRIASFSLAIARRDERINDLQRQANELTVSIRSRNDQDQENLIAALEAIKNSKVQKITDMQEAVNQEDIPLVMRKCLLEVYSCEIEGIEKFLRRLRDGMEVKEASGMWED